MAKLKYVVELTFSDEVTDNTVLSEIQSMITKGLVNEYTSKQGVSQMFDIFDKTIPKLEIIHVKKNKEKIR